MRLIVITIETFFDGEAASVNLLFENGLETLHLRKPFASRHETMDFIRLINTDYHSRIVLHDHYDLAELLNLRGIHLNRRNQGTKVGCNTGTNFGYNMETNVDYNQGTLVGCNSDIHKEDKNVFLEKRILSVSRSCHSLEDIKVSSDCDYVFLSPVFDSISKIGYKQGFTPEQLHDAKRSKLINGNVIALGGLTAKNIPVAHHYGFGGVAVLGSLWSDFPANGNESELLKRFIELKIACEKHLSC